MINFRRIVKSVFIALSAIALFLIHSLPGYTEGLSGRECLRVPIIDNNLTNAMDKVKNDKRRALLRKGLGELAKSPDNMRVMTEAELRKIDPGLTLGNIKGGLKIYLFTKEQLKGVLKGIAKDSEIDDLLKNLTPILESAEGQEDVTGPRNRFMLEAYSYWLSLLDDKLKASWVTSERARVLFSQDLSMLDDVMEAVEIKVRRTALIFGTMAHDGTIYDPRPALENIAGCYHLIGIKRSELGEDLAGNISLYVDKWLREAEAFDTHLNSIPTGPDAEFDVEAMKIVKDYVERVYADLKEAQNRANVMKNTYHTDSLLGDNITLLKSRTDYAVETFQNRMNAMNGVVKQKELFKVDKLIDSKDEKVKADKGDLLSKYANEFAQEIEVIIEDNIPDVFANRDMIFAALVNILHNAKQLKKDLNITRITIYVGFDEERNEVVIKIRDNGKGFNKEMFTGRRRETDKWHEIDVGSGKTFREGGTGLGLRQTDLEITLNGGIFEVFSMPGKGSEFIVRLPVPEKEPETVEEAAESIIELIKSFPSPEDVPKFKCGVACQHNRERSVIISYYLKRRIPKELREYIDINSYALEIASESLSRYYDTITQKDPILKDHIPRLLPYNDLGTFDLILVMTENQRQTLVAKLAAKDKVRMALPGEDIEIISDGLGKKTYDKFKEYIQRRINEIILPVFLEYGEKLRKEPITLKESGKKENYEPEDPIRIIERMVQSINSLLELWKTNATYAPDENVDNRPLYIAKVILYNYFRDHRIGNIFNRTRGFLKIYSSGDGLQREFIDKAFGECEEIIKHFDNIEIDSFKGNEAINKDSIKDLLNPNSLPGTMWGITKQDIDEMEKTLTPDEKTEMVKRYIDSLKEVVTRLREDYDKLIWNINRENNSIEIKVESAVNNRTGS